MRVPMLETFVVAALFTAAIAVTGAITARQPMQFCSAMAAAGDQHQDAIYADPWESRRLEE